MTMFEFMLNSLYLLAGVVCIVIAVFIVYCACITAYKLAIAIHKRDGRPKR